MVKGIRIVRGLVGVTLGLSLLACGPTPAASPTAAPAQPAPTAAAAKPAEKAAEAAPAKPAAEAKPAAAAAPAKPTTPEEIFLYSGPDRQQILEDGAKKEGKLLWYTSLIIQDRARPLAEAFKQKYPFMNVDIVRLEGNEATSRTAEEYRANKFDVDFFEQSYPAITGLKGARILAKFTSPWLDGIPKEVIDPEGYFVGDRENPLGLAYNTKLIPDAEAPKTYDDLLNPKWKGKLATQDTSQAVQAFGAMLLIKGEDYVRKLATQDVTVYSQSARAVTDLVVAGEAPMNFPSSVGHVALLRKQSAPVAWAPLEQAPTALGYAAIAVKAPHPYSAALFTDFILSKDGQQAMSDTGEGATRTGIQNDYGGYENFKKLYMDLAVPQSQYTSEYQKWADLQKSLLVNRRAG